MTNNVSGGGTFQYNSVDEFYIDTAMKVETSTQLEINQGSVQGLPLDVPMFPIVIGSDEQQAVLWNGFKLQEQPLGIEGLIRLTLIYDGGLNDFQNSYQQLVYPTPNENGAEWSWIKAISQIPGVIHMKTELANASVSTQTLHLPIRWAQDVNVPLSGEGHEEGDPLKRFLWSGSIAAEHMLAAIDATELLSRLQAGFNADTDGEADINFDEEDIEFDKRLTLNTSVTMVRILYVLPFGVTVGFAQINSLLSCRITPYGEYVELDDSSFAQMMRLQLMNERAGS